ncbi:MAG TPA: NUMOD3 domain-containing DNA-binding protein [Methanosarcina sp.]|nr:NUMOD3 domain-containing DNA-binding protein [Methanosarcina sp.]
MQFAELAFPTALTSRKDINMCIYYVYAYLRKDNTPYYIGKGKDDRAYESHYKNGRGVHVPKDKSQIIFLEKNLSEIGAFALERRYIAWYGRKDLGTGILNNRTDGGEGIAGFNHSVETRKKMSQSHQGKTRSPEFCRKLSVARKGLKFGPPSAERRSKISAAMTGVAKATVKCPHCNKIGGSNVMQRWHFDNCKFR